MDTMNQSGDHSIMAHSMTVKNLSNNEYIYNTDKNLLAAKDAEIAALKNVIETQKQLIETLKQLLQVKGQIIDHLSK